MKNLFKILPFMLLLLIGCSDDEETPDINCTTDPAVTVSENIIGTWIVDNAMAETVTFNSDGSGSSSEDSFEFSTSNDGNDYHNFNWTIENDTIVVVAYDYSPDTPVIPFIVSEDYTVNLNECDRVEMTSAFGSETSLTR